MPVPADDTRIRLLKTAFVIYYHADLTKARKFLLDFGLEIAQETEGQEIFFKGYGTEPFVYIARKSHSGTSEFGGAAYEVESYRELERATQIPGATQEIINLDGFPGGGRMVTLTDPVGHRVHLVHGQSLQQQQADIRLEKLTVNYEDEKPRKGRFQRFQPGPAPVHRWGHYGVTYPDGMYHEMYNWYTQTITLAPSDVVYKDGKPITCFFHIDRGLEYTDHHAFFFKKVKPEGRLDVAHAAFEVHDFDIQQLGHQHLEDQGYKLCWGVGRVSFACSSNKSLDPLFLQLADLYSSTQHVLGSQVFDYWFDPSKFVLVGENFLDD